MDPSICPIRKYTIHDDLGKIEGSHPLAVKFDVLDYLEQGDLSVQTFINTPNGENQEVIYITLKAEAYFDTYADLTL